MRKTDAQLKALLNACTLPILGAKWTLTGSNVRPEIINFVELELGLQKLESRTRRNHHHTIQIGEKIAITRIG